MREFGIFWISNTGTRYDFYQGLFLANPDGVMNFDVKAEQRSYIKFCVELGRTPVQTKNMLKQTQCGRNISRALVYRWHKRFSDKLFSKNESKGAGRPSVTTEELTSVVQESLENDTRLTIRTISSNGGFFILLKGKCLNANLV